MGFRTLRVINDEISYQVNPDRSVWLHVAQGEVNIDDRVLLAGDAIAYAGGSKFDLSSPSSGEVLLFDLG